MLPLAISPSYIVLVANQLVYDGRKKNTKEVTA